MRLHEVRTALRAARAARKKDGLTLDRLQEQSGVDRAVIHRIENVRKYPHYDPAFDTIARLIEGMGLRLSEFFTQLEATSNESRITDATQKIVSSTQQQENLLQSHVNKLEDTAHPPHLGGNTDAAAAFFDTPEFHAQADALARAMVDFVRAGLARADGSRDVPRARQPKGRRALHRRE